MRFGFKRLFSVTVTAMCLLGALTGCGSGDETDATVSLEADAAPSVNSGAPAAVQPDINVSVAPPAAGTPKNNEEAATNFFGKKEAYDGFSQNLKDKIFETYTIDPNVDLAGNGNGYYNTLIGRSSPITYVRSGEIIDGVGCDPSGSFLCLDSPEDNFETINPGIDVIGNIDLNQLAVFGAEDPVAVVSVFNNSGGGAASEILVMPGDVEETSDPNIGHFKAAVGLSGSGKFTIVVSAYRVINDGAANELISILVSGTRLEAPEIEFVEARPEYNKLAESGHEKDPVQENAVIASTILNVKVKLLTAGGDGVQTKFENYDSNGNFKSAVAAVPVPEGADTMITGKVPLHQGVNKIKIISRVPALDALLGDDAPPPAELSFTLFNVDGGPKLKIIKPEKRGIIVPQNVSSGQKVNLEFCYTFVPSKVEGSSGGTGGAPAPTIGDECQGGSLGFTPEIYLNGVKVEGPDAFSYDASSGKFTVSVTPEFGVNLYEIRTTEEFGTAEEAKTTTSATGAFDFGVPMAYIHDGQVATGDEGRKSFTQRGGNLDIDKSLLKGDVKKLLVKFLNQDTTADLVLSIFKKKANTPGYVCDETDAITVSHGDTTINFDADTFKMGSIELTSLEPNSDGMLHIGAKINGMHGEAELRAAEETGNTFNGKDLGFIPVNFAMASLEINVGVAFTKNSDGVSQLDLRKLPDAELVKIVGDGPLGRPIFVDSSRNPLAAGLELLDWQQGILLTQFDAIIQGTLLCGVEEGLNNANTGALGKNVADLDNLLSTASNVFRLALHLDLSESIGKILDLQIAYNALRGTIKIDAQGVHIENIPLRFNPGTSQLTDLATELSDGFIGAVSRWKDANESSTQKSLTTDDYGIGLQLGEDAINQVLAAAVLSGVIDLTIDANFYNTLGSIPAEKLAPNGSSLAANVDLNLDGQVNEEDQTAPVSMDIKTDKYAPPMVTFLSKAEVQALANEEESARTVPTASPVPDPSVAAAPGPDAEPFFTPNGKYIKIVIPNLEITTYRNARIPDSLGGTQTYCKRQWSDPPSVAAKGYCQLAGDVLIPGANPLEVPDCEGGNLVSLPRKNGDKISYGPDPTADNLDEVVPLYKMKGGIILHAKILPIDRDISYKEKALRGYTGNSEPVPVKTLIHLQFAPKESAATAMLLSMEMVENNTGASDSSLLGNFDTILTGAFAAQCQNLNELRIPLPEKFEGKIPEGGTEPAPLVDSFDIDSIDIGGTDNLPQVFIDDNHLYLDVLLHVGLNLTD